MGFFFLAKCKYWTCFAGSDGDFVFDFGNPSQDGDGGGDITFHFNFGGGSDEQNAAEKNEAFNFFGF